MRAYRACGVGWTLFGIAAPSPAFPILVFLPFHIWWVACVVPVLSMADGGGGAAARERPPPRPQVPRTRRVDHPRTYLRRAGAARGGGGQDPHLASDRPARWAAAYDGRYGTPPSPAAGAAGGGGGSSGHASVTLVGGSCRPRSSADAAGGGGSSGGEVGGRPRMRPRVSNGGVDGVHGGDV